MDATDSLTLFTVGHSNRTLVEFTALLSASEIACVVDVRSQPGSRAYPHFDSEALAVSLPAAGIAYLPMPALGGRRQRSLPKADTRNAMWRNRSFRYYADYALSDAFAEALAHLRRRGREKRTTIMCAEAVWWRCHRRIITDHLLAQGDRVEHIMGPGQVTTATLTPGARVADSRVTYPPADDLFPGGE